MIVLKILTLLLIIAVTLSVGVALGIALIALVSANDKGGSEDANKR